MFATSGGGEFSPVVSGSSTLRSWVRVPPTTRRRGTLSRSPARLRATSAVSGRSRALCCRTANVSLMLVKAKNRCSIQYRLAWTRTYLKGMGLLTNSKRGPTVARPRRRRDGSWCPARRGSGRHRDQAARPADSCNSTQPRVRRVMLVACWWAHAIVESTDIAQSIAPAPSAVASSRPGTRSQLPSALICRCQVDIVCHGPNALGTSRRAIPHRYRDTIPSITRRASRKGLPRLPVRDGQQILDQRPLRI